MKICYIINDLNRKAGTEKASILVANSLSTLGIDVSIMSFVKVIEPGYKLSEQVKVIDLGFDEHQSFKLNYFRIVSQIKDLVKKILLIL